MIKKEIKLKENLLGSASIETSKANISVYSDNITDPILQYTITEEYKDLAFRIWDWDSHSFSLTEWSTWLKIYPVLSNPNILSPIRGEKPINEECETTIDLIVPRKIINNFSLFVDSDFGSVTLNDIALSNARIITRSGDISLNGTKFRGIILTESGNITLRNTNVESAEFQTHNGDIDAEVIGSPDDFGRCLFPPYEVVSIKNDKDEIQPTAFSKKRKLSTSSRYGNIDMRFNDKR